MRHLTSLITSVCLVHLVLDSPSTFHSSLNVDRFLLNFSTMLPCVSFHSFINNSIGFERSRAWPRIQLCFSIIHSRPNTSQVSPSRVDLRLMYLSSMLQLDSFIYRIIVACKMHSGSCRTCKHLSYVFTFLSSSSFSSSFSHRTMYFIQCASSPAMLMTNFHILEALQVYGFPFFAIFANWLSSIPFT